MAEQAIESEGRVTSHPPASFDAEPKSGIEVHGDPDGGVHVHVHPWQLYAGILGALLVLTVITVAVSLVDIDYWVHIDGEVRGVGAWNLAVAILIAVAKASLVVLYFMHLREDSRFNALFFLGSILFVGIFLAYTLNDTNLRGQLDTYNGVHIDPQTGERAPGGISGPIAGQELEPGLARPAPAAAAAPAAAGEDEAEEDAAGAEAEAESAEGEATETDGEGEPAGDDAADADSGGAEAGAAAATAEAEPEEGGAEEAAAADASDGAGEAGSDAEGGEVTPSP
ncbi:MAG: cytochrome C oxidase subunit IV family protein [Sandaracinaceae bacterium]